jgi:hypothetical protein
MKSLFLHVLFHPDFLDYFCLAQFLLFQKFISRDDARPEVVKFVAYVSDNMVFMENIHKTAVNPLT